MAGSLLDIYGNYGQAVNRYSGQANAYNKALDAYLAQVDAYNAAANKYNTGLTEAQKQYQAQVDAYNATIQTDPNLYNQYGDYLPVWQGDNNATFTEYNGKTIGRVNPIETYQAQQTEYGSIDEWGNPVSNLAYYDPRTGLGYNEGNFDYASENAYLNPQTGLVSIFTSRPGDFSYAPFTETVPAEFTMEKPTAPNAPPPSEVTTTANIRPEELYQQQFGRPTADVMSSEAWSLANLSSPFFSSEPTTAYETGGVNAMNNPLAYVAPDALTTGQTNIDQNSQIYGQNPYY